MIVDYHENEHLNTLLLVLEDHSNWFHALVQCIFYPEESELLTSIKKPTSFAQWFVHASREDGMPPEIIEKLSALHSDLFKMADTLVLLSKETGVKPKRKSFNKFLMIYEEFLLYIRRLERDILLDGIGYDAFTGLRSKKLIFSDIERELHRLARQGKSFCVAMIKIDDFDLIQKHSDKNESQGYIKLISSLIKLSIRSFDDAYYMEGDEFVLCLKQADISGGIAALERLRSQLEAQSVNIRNGDSSEKALSMSCCIAEPVAADDAHELVKNLRSDLSSSQGEKTDAVLEYHELSPLQRYIQEGK